MRESDIKNYLMMAGGFAATLIFITLLSKLAALGSAAFIPLAHKNLDQITASRGQGCLLPDIPEDAFVQFVNLQRGTKNPPLVVASDTAHQTTMVNLKLTRNDKPVFLILSSRAPILWNLHKAGDVTVAGILAIGLHGQILANVPEGISPSFLVQKDPKFAVENCIAMPELVRHNIAKARVTEILQNHFGRGPDDFIFAVKRSTIQIGPDRGFEIPLQPVDAAAIFAVTPVVDGREEKRDQYIAALVDEGSLFPLSQAKLDALKELIRSSNPGISLHNLFRKMASGNEIYIASGPLVLPAGMKGSKSATILLPRGIERPQAPENDNVYIKLPLELNEIYHLI